MSTAQITLPFEDLRTAVGAPRRSGGKSLSRNVPQAPRRAAVRVPEAWHQAEIAFPALPQLFVHEGARQLLEKRLSAALGEPCALHVTDNRRTMISSQRSGGLLHLRLHHMFLLADAFTTTALGRYLRNGDRTASAVLGSFIEANRQQIRPVQRRTRSLRTSGTHHELSAIFDELNRAYFGGMVDAQITWGRRGTALGGRRRRQSIRLGTYCAELKLIRVHPALDQDWVPRFFVEYIVFHEMLHHVVPMPVENGRRQFHTPEFRARERLFEHYERAIRWEKRQVRKLLAAG